jgi:hypothetical protein
MTTDNSRTAALLERSFSLVNEAMFTVSLQYRRWRGTEPEDTTFLFRRQADFQFLLVALRKMRQAATILPSASVATQQHLRLLPATEQPTAMVEAIRKAVDTFDTAVPNLMLFRNVSEHLDEYMLGLGRARSVHPGQTQVWSWDDGVVEWVGQDSFDVDKAVRAAEDLFIAMQTIKNSSWS